MTVVLHEPAPVLVAIRRVDDQHKVIAAQPIEVGIVHGAAMFVGDERILRLAGPECTGVIGQHVQQERLGTSPGYAKAAHVRDVEQPGLSARGEVFLDDAALVLDRHIPAAEFHHLGPMAHVPAVQNGFTQCVFGHDQVTQWFLLLPLQAIAVRQGHGANPPPH